MKPLKPTTVKRRLLAIELKQCMARADANALIAKLEMQRAAIIARCPHHWVHIPDPAGGRGDDHCPICGEYK